MGKAVSISADICRLNSQPSPLQSLSFLSLRDIFISALSMQVFK